MADIEENAAIVNALQRHATVVVQKSIMEGFGLTVAEAMWKSRPVVASAVGGIQDQIKDGVAGLLLADPNDLGQFGDRTLRLLGDPDLAAQMGARGREVVRTPVPRKPPRAAVHPAVREHDRLGPSAVGGPARVRDRIGIHRPVRIGCAQGLRKGLQLRSCAIPHLIQRFPVHPGAGADRGREQGLTVLRLVVCPDHSPAICPASWRRQTCFGPGHGRLVRRQLGRPAPPVVTGRSATSL